jgi:recombination protein RecR
MSFGPLIDELVDAFRVLPGVGQKTAQRMALTILEQQRAGGVRLSKALAKSIDGVGRCESCNNLSETSCCAICANPAREQGTLCVVESPSDVLAIEQTHQYKGRYFVLNGSLSPIDGRGPNEVGIPELIHRINVNQINELIMATNPTVEGEATAYYIAELLAESTVLVTRLAHGIPLGGELGFVDGGTLSHAFIGRKPLQDD